MVLVLCGSRVPYFYDSPHCLNQLQARPELKNNNNHHRTESAGWEEEIKAEREREREREREDDDAANH